MTNPAAIPGTGLSYTALCDTERDSEVRAVWSALASLADAVGVQSMQSTGYGARTKTTDELVAALTQSLPEGADLLGVAGAFGDLCPEVPQRTVAYEVRSMRAFDGAPMFSVYDTFDTSEEAEEVKAALVDRYPEYLFLVVKVETITTRTAQ